MGLITDASVLNGFFGQNVLDCKSRDYLTNIAEWQEIRTAFDGGKDWAELVTQKYECESKASLDFRKTYAVNRIPIKTPVQALQNTARSSSEDAIIEGASERINDVLNNDFDNNGNQWYVWATDNVLSDVIKYGKSFIFASTPATVSEITKSEEKDNNPYAFSRNPLQVLNWRYENGNTRENGQFSDILFLTSEMVIDSETRFEREIETAVRITRDFVIVMAVNSCSTINMFGDLQEFKVGEIIRAFDNELGIVPCRMVDIGGSLIQSGVNISAQALNIQTASFASTFDSNYSQKWISGGEAPEEFTTGASTMMSFPDKDTEYNVTPNPTNDIDNATSFNDDLQNAFDNSMQQQYNNLAKKGSEVPSGEALKEINAPQGQAVKYINDQIGDSLDDVIAWMHKLAGEDVPADLSGKMPTSYESRDTKDRIQSALDLQLVNANSEKGKEIIEREKWSNFSKGEELKEVVEAELKAEPQVPPAFSGEIAS